MCQSETLSKVCIVCVRAQPAWGGPSSVFAAKGVFVVTAPPPTLTPHPLFYSNQPRSSARYAIPPRLGRAAPSQPNCIPAQALSKSLQQCQTKFGANVSIVGGSYQLVRDAWETETNRCGFGARERSDSALESDPGARSVLQQDDSERSR